jgi:hypothetical protein
MERQDEERKGSLWMGARSNAVEWQECRADHWHADEGSAADRHATQRTPPEWQQRSNVMEGRRQQSNALAATRSLAMHGKGLHRQESNASARTEALGWHWIAPAGTVRTAADRTGMQRSGKHRSGSTRIDRYGSEGIGRERTAVAGTDCIGSEWIGRDRSDTQRQDFEFRHALLGCLCFGLSLPQTEEDSGQRVKRCRNRKKGYSQRPNSKAA